MRSWYVASLVSRWHTWPTINQETVGQHTHGVMMLFMRLFATDYDDPSLAYEYILKHDLAELWTGDLPFPVKRRYLALAAALADPEYDAEVAMGLYEEGERVRIDKSMMIRIKVCDMLQMHLFGMHEYRMGNHYALPIVRDAITVAMQTAAGDDYAVRQINKFAEENGYELDASKR